MKKTLSLILLLIVINNVSAQKIATKKIREYPFSYSNNF